MKEIFITNNYDSNIALTDGVSNYTFLDLKKMISSKILEIENLNKNVVILEKNKLSFIINFFASIFSQKNIFLLSDEKRLASIKFDFNLLDSFNFQKTNDIYFPNIDFKNININFYTSGSTGVPKTITTTLDNLILEAYDINKIIKFDNIDIIYSSAKLSHRYGLVTHLLLSFINKTPLNIKNVYYPDNIDKKNSILVTTPTFLNSVLKYDNQFVFIPKYIFSAGSKLKDEIFEHFRNKTNVVEIYGSTETGDIGYRFSNKENFKPFFNVGIKSNKENVEISSPYTKENAVKVNDSIELINGEIVFKNRTDRLFKIYEKRVSADEIELNLKKNDFVSDCYITKHNDKLTCLCALSPLGEEYLLKSNITCLISNLKKYLLNNFEIIPQRWKFIDEIPMNQMGKINKDFISHIFNINLSLPIILKRKLENNTIYYTIYFYKQCNFFKGHFEKYKIVPGVVQLYYAKEFANAHFNLSIGEGQYKRIKFSNVIKENSIVTLKLKKDEKTVSFEFYFEDKNYSSGTFLCNNIFKGEL